MIFIQICVLCVIYLLLGAMAFAFLDLKSDNEFDRICKAQESVVKVLIWILWPLILWVGLKDLYFPKRRRK